MVSVRDFGVFVKIPGFRRQSLVPLSQVAVHRVERSELPSLAREGQEVWIKILSVVEIDGGPPRLTGSMKVVDQLTGRDLDEDGAEVEAEARRLRDRGQGGPRGGDPAPPAPGSIHQGTVKSVHDYGAFVEVPGHSKQGLLHISAVADRRIESSELPDVVPVGSRPWVKVDSVEEATGKYRLSMKDVDQGSGRDLDPDGVHAGGGAGRAPEPGGLARGAAGGVHWGHLAAEPFRPSGDDGKKYDLVTEARERAGART